MGETLAKRLEGQPPEVVAYAWTAHCRLSTRHRTLTRRKAHNKAVVPVAREFAGFVWGIMTDRIQGMEMQKRAGDKFGKILEAPMRPNMRVFSGRQVPARSRCAVSIRGYQSGRAPMPCARSLVHLELNLNHPELRGVDRPFHIRCLP